MNDLALVGAAGLMKDGPIRIGALAPLSPPGWVEAGRHLLAGLELAVETINTRGGIGGRPLSLIVGDTAADPRKAAAIVADQARQGAVAVVGEYHSIVARAAAQAAEDHGLPFLCSSAVMDRLVDRPSHWVAGLSPPQSRGWRAYAQYLRREGHEHVVAIAATSPYWSSGMDILRANLGPRSSLAELDVAALGVAGTLQALADSGASAALLLVGHPEPAMSLVRSIRNHPRLVDVLIGAPAGQPELPAWAEVLGPDGGAVPFLRYRPDRLTELGQQVEQALRQRLGQAPSFVALEGYDTIIALSALLGLGRRAPPASQVGWPSVVVDGTRGMIGFDRAEDQTVWRWVDAPVQIVDRDPARPDRFRTLYVA
ncbi:ABC transporter substrate-binding protein [Caulobacter sp. UNC358MFTsu5.1]|uniref:ABC transporter substrate-binding protein n=1 Tax=Caulobacter sp. UNC358MFTsu5.1 TaxID=1449049 RepID=UPI000550D8A7|nr:ABC transporter substrate-binding protein [Caulobacter sp. UNC358MFTsu5.1]